VRATAFSLSPDEATERVCSRLAELGIAPGAAAAPRSDRAPTGDLESRVRARAEQIRRGSRATLRAISSADAG
jgi:hypothetical protein